MYNSGNPGRPGSSVRSGLDAAREVRIMDGRLLKLVESDTVIFGAKEKKNWWVAVGEHKRHDGKKEGMKMFCTGWMAWVVVQLQTNPVDTRNLASKGKIKD